MNNQNETQEFIYYFARKYLNNVLPNTILEELNSPTDATHYPQKVLEWEQKIAVLHQWDNVLEKQNEYIEEINVIKEGLFTNKKLWVGYSGKEKRFLFNPFGLVIRNQQYFLIGSQWNFTNPLMYAIRNIEYINISDEDALEAPKNFNLYSFANGHLNNTSEKIIEVLEVEFPNAIRSYIDDYPLVAKKVVTQDSTQGYFILRAEQLENSIGLYQWLSGFTDQIYIKQPSFMRELINKDLIDSLTKLYNRNFFDHLIHRELQHCKRHTKYYFSLLLLDIDHFKRINDIYGHNEGDKALVAVANALRSDEAIRYGGEEFYVVVSNQDKQTSFSVAERIRKTIESIDLVSEEGAVIPLRVSIGITDYSDNYVNMHEIDIITELKAQADKALYKAKETGRNQCIIFET